MASTSVELTALAGAFAGGDELSSAEIGNRIARLIEMAVAAWPDVAVDELAFASHLGRRMSAEQLADEAIAARAGDLWIACACTLGDPHAIAQAMAAFRPPMESALRRVLGPSEVDEAAARAWEHLFVGSHAVSPKIGHYKGRGPLRSFVCTVASRLAISAGRKQRPASADDDELVRLADDSDDPELLYLKQRYRDEFRQSFANALAGLSAPQRLLLRLDVVDKLTIDDAAAIYGRSRSTTGRHLIEARDELARATIADLRARLDLGTAEAQSIARLVRSQLHLSVERLLGA